jgi:hypothetical protein
VGSKMASAVSKMVVVLANGAQSPTRAQGAGTADGVGSEVRRARRIEAWAASVPWDERCALAVELNSKLAIIVGQCELLTDHATDPECIRRLQAIYDAAQAMAEQVKRHQCPMGAMV